MKIDLNKEKTSAKLLYLFDSDFYYKRNLYVESESNEDKGVFLTMLKKIFGFIKSILKRFAFIAILAFLIILGFITSSETQFIFGIISGIIMGTGMEKATKYLKAMGVEGAIANINNLLKENNYKEIDFETKGLCYKNSELIYLSEAIKTCLDQDEENDFDNKKLKKIIKNIKDREEIEDKLNSLLNNEDSNAVGYLESHGYSKITVEDFITLDKNNKKTLLSKVFDELENKYAYKAYNPEKVQLIQGLRSKLYLNKTFLGNFSKKNAFGIKPVMNYLSNKAKSIQNMLSDLLMLIISIFNPKTYSESNLTVKREIKKIKFFLENYLNNDKENVFYEEKEKHFYNENFNLPFSKEGNPGNVIKITYKVKDHKVVINSITNQVSIYGSNSASLWKEIFPSKNIEGESYKWQKGEWNIIRKYIENKNIDSNIEINNKEKTNDKNDNEENNAEIDDKQNNLKTNDDQTDNNKDEQTETDAENKQEEDITKADEKIDSTTIKKKTSYLLLMKKGIESTPVKYLIIGLIIAIPFLLKGMTAGASSGVEVLADLGAKAVNSSANAGLIAEIAKWLGWGSFTFGMGYIGIKKYIESMNKKMLADSMENAEKNSSKLEGKITPALDQIKTIAEKDEKKTSLMDKAKNLIGINKKPINDNFNYKHKKELLYNENYIMLEYFKIEKKLKNPVF